jgi:hypothetical protein
VFRYTALQINLKWGFHCVMFKCGKTKRPAKIMSMICESKMAYAERSGRKINLEKKKLSRVVQYFKIMKGVDREYQYLSYYLILKKKL